MASPPSSSHRVPCVRCGELMQLVRTVAPVQRLPALQVFVCPACGDVETRSTPASVASPRRRNS